jgi:hypothetical protein
MNLTQFFEHWRIAENPFRGEEARHDAVFQRIGLGAASASAPANAEGPLLTPEHYAERRRLEQSAHHSDFEKIVGNLASPSTSIVFGEKGSGKTAIRLQLASRIAAHNGANPTARILLIAYDDLNAVLDRYARRAGGKSTLEALQKFRLVDHMDAILANVVPRLADRFLASPPGREPLPMATGPLPGEALDLGPEPRRTLRRLPAHERRDLLLLQAVYDRPEVADQRTPRLRRLLRLPPLWGDLIWSVLAWLGWIPAGAVVANMIAHREPIKVDSNSGYLVGALLALWLLFVFKRLAWDKLGLVRIGRRIRRQLRTQNRPDTSYARSVRFLDPALRDSSHLPLSESDEARYAMFARLLSLLRRFGYAGVVIVIDRVDEPTLVSGDPDRMRAIAWPLLNNKFLQQGGLGIKMLLPIELRHALFKESSAFFQEARLDKQSLVERLTWTGPMLYELCDARLRACLEPGAPPIALLDLFAEDVTGRDLVDALDQMHQPRDAFKFLYACIAEHCSNVTVEHNAWKVPRQVLESVRKQQSDRVQQLYRGIRPA